MFFIVFIWMLFVVIMSLYVVVFFVYLLLLGFLFFWLFYICFLLLVICGLYLVLFVKMWWIDWCRLDRECKLMVILFMVIVFFIVVYFLMVVFGVKYFVFNRKMSNFFFNIMSFFNFGNFFVNLFLYVFRMLDFRRVVCLLFGIYY